MSFRRFFLLTIALGACGNSHGLNGEDEGDGEPDSAAAARCDACGPGSTCLRGACVDDCGGDPSTFDADLAADLRPIANVCHSLPAGTFAAHARDGAAFTLVHLQIERPGRFR